VHIYVLGPKPLRWNFIRIFLLSIRSGAHKLFRRFFIAILQKSWRHLATKMRKKSSPSERAIPSEKSAETVSKLTYNSDTKPAQSIPPRTNSAPASERDKNRHTVQTHFRTYSRRSLFDLPKLCMVIELIMPILKGSINQSINQSISLIATLRPDSRIANDMQLK